MPKLPKVAPRQSVFALNMGGEIKIAAHPLLPGIAGTKVARVQVLRVDIVSEPLISKLKQNHKGYISVTSFIVSLIAVLAKESKDAKVDEHHSQQECKAFIVESAASRAEKVKEVEELKDTRGVSDGKRRLRQL